MRKRIIAIIFLCFIMLFLFKMGEAISKKELKSEKLSGHLMQIVLYLNENQIKMQTLCSEKTFPDSIAICLGDSTEVYHR